MDLADLVRLAEASIPKAADGTPIPPIMLEAARQAVDSMVGAGMTPSKTAVIQQLRLSRFSVGKGMEDPIWRHVAPMVDTSPALDPDGTVSDESDSNLWMGPRSGALVELSPSVLVGDELRDSA
ncbi:hypothetical protein [Frankia sp. AgW1.1]|uniref:hypothetical protein n=1 Tax=Frankia sp. AgW1.1 TaxID=1836971 RepID=UPI00193182DA|nr:hypothetical protein [Frankia sp. AgW1.1]MBL7487024.1 hypothetical protein [Frankia sp. AgW1.1]